MKVYMEIVMFLLGKINGVYIQNILKIIIYCGEKEKCFGILLEMTKEDSAGKTGQEALNEFQSILQCK